MDSTLVRRISDLSFTQSTDQESAQRAAPQEPEHEGYIESLTISNFKSYYGETRIGPFSRFTCIIGPNGSGKSNLMDAISFVLGIKTQHLRGKKLSDLIHRVNLSQSSSSSSQDAVSQPTRAYVQLVFVSTKNESEERMVFRRTITSEGQTVNEYNEQRLPLKQYEQRLEEIGVIVRARNFLVFQGDVTGIAQKSGKELTKWIEQISGSDQLKTSYDAARKEQEEISNQYEAVNERNRNLAKEKKQMKQQKDEVSQYQSTENELAALKSEYYRFQLYHIDNDVRLAHQHLQNAQASITAEDGALQDLEDDIKLKQSDLSKTLRQKNSVCKNLKSKQQKLEKKKLKRAELDKQCTCLRQEQQRLSTQEDELGTALQRNNDELHELKTNEHEVRHEFEAYEAKLATQENELALEESQYATYQRIKHELCQETATLAMRKSALQNIYSRVHDTLEVRESELNMLRERQQKLSTTRRELQASATQIEQERDANVATLTRYREQHAALEQRDDSLQQDRARINTALETLHCELREMELGIRDNERDKQQLNVLQSLQKLFGGIYGRLCDLVHVRQQRYNLAVTVALGVNHSAIVVDSKEVAQKCMAHMRKTRRGHFRFIPLRDIKTMAATATGASAQLQRLGMGGSAQSIVNVISYETQFERAVQFALGNCVVVDDMREARQISSSLSSSSSSSSDAWSQPQQQRVRIVTLDGSIIQSNGNICGGFCQELKEKASRFSLREKDKKITQRNQLIEQLKRVDDEKMALFDELHEQAEDGGGNGGGECTSMQELATRMHEMESNVRNLDLRVQTLQAQCAEKESTISALQSELDRKQSQCAQTRREVENAKQDLDACDEEMQRKEHELFAPVAHELGVTSIREYEEQKLQRIEQRSEQRKTFNVKLTELQNKFEFVENKNRENSKELKRIETRLTTIDEELQEMQQEKLQALNTAIETEQLQVNAEEEKSDTIQQQCQEKRTFLSEIKKQINRKRGEITKTKQKRNELQGWIAKLAQTQNNVLQQARHEQIELKQKKKQQKKKKKKSNKNKNRKKHDGHRRKRRKKNDGESSDEQESDDVDDGEEEEHKTDDEDLTDNQESDDEDEDEDEEDEDVNEEDEDVEAIQERMQQRLRGIDLSEFETSQQQQRRRRSNRNNTRNRKEEMDVDEDEEEDEEEEASDDDSKMPDEDEDKEDGHGEEHYESRKKEYLAQIEEMAKRLNEYQPNMKAIAQYKKLQQRYKDGSKEHRDWKKKLTEVNKQVERLTAQRSNQFTQCFDVVKANIVGIYSQLTVSKQYKRGGKAFLDIGSTQSNPFDDEIIFNAMPPGKPFREMQQLSGGEKSVASLALLFAIHSYKASPFFILDEIDAALDQRNVQRVCDYIRDKAAHNTQIIVISLKDKFYSHANSLIGVCKDRSHSDSSMVLSIDLTKYDPPQQSRKRNANAANAENLENNGDQQNVNVVRDEEDEKAHVL